MSEIDNNVRQIFGSPQILVKDAYGIMYPLSNVPSKRDIKCFFNRCTEYDVSRVKIWVEVFGINPNVSDKKGTTGLMMARRSCRPETVEYLLSKGANPHHKDKKGRYW